MPASVLTDLALALSLRPVAGVDPLGVLGEVAEEIVRALHVEGAVLVVPFTGWVCGSDATVTLVGEIQRRDGHGPLSTTMRTTRPMLTPDLTRIGPPALAALAGEVGFTSSAAIALLAGGQVVGALQLIGRVGRPVETWHIDALVPALGVLSARITDMIEVWQLRRSPALTPPPLSVPTETDQPVCQPSRAGVARPDAGRPASGEPRPDRHGPAEFTSRSLSEAPPEIVTEEMRAIGPNMLPLQRQHERPRSRHRREG